MAAFIFFWRLCKGKLHTALMKVAMSVCLFVRDSSKTAERNFLKLSTTQCYQNFVDIFQFCLTLNQITNFFYMKVCTRVRLHLQRNSLNILLNDTCFGIKQQRQLRYIRTFARKVTQILCNEHAATRSFSVLTTVSVQTRISNPAVFQVILKILSFTNLFSPPLKCHIVDLYHSADKVQFYYIQYTFLRLSNDSRGV